jgi:hypothetical protein
MVVDVELGVVLVSLSELIVRALYLGASVTSWIQGACSLSEV